MWEAGAVWVAVWFGGISENKSTGRERKVNKIVEHSVIMSDLTNYLKKSKLSHSETLKISVSASLQTVEHLILGR